ncbi:hypothetical protein ACFX19_040433 [Malus domestica]
MEISTIEYELDGKSASGVLCDCRRPLKLKGKFYRTAIRLAMLYGTECWVVKHQHVHKMGVAEMRMLRGMCGHTRKDKIVNEDRKYERKSAPVILNMCKEGRLTLRFEDVTTGQRFRAEGVEEDLGQLWKRL